MTADVGVIGLGVMGYGFVMNLEENGYNVAIANYEPEMIDEVMQHHPTANLIPTYSLREFVETLERPRKIFLIIKAGKPTDDTINKLLKLLDEGDILINGGNTHFQETIMWTEKLDNQGLNYVGLGVSGGEEGARYGAALMPGCSRETYEKIQPMLESIAAKAPQDGEPCVSYLGSDGAGHFTKMIHNGIEYSDSQLIAESYHLMRHYLGLEVEELSKIYTEWNQGELESYLIEITAEILKKYDDETNKPMIDVILDNAKSKGTGKWASKTALDVHMPFSVVTEAVFARYTSELKEERVAASEVYPLGYGTFNGNIETYIEKIRRALYFAKIMSYTQGFAVYHKANDIYDGWELNEKSIAKIFRAGCVIRAALLEQIAQAYSRDSQLKNLLFDSYFKDIINEYHQDARDIVSDAMKNGYPMPGMASAVSYFDNYRSETMSANLVQAQRDYFGAHTFERVDKPGNFHYEWFEL